MRPQEPTARVRYIGRRPWQDKPSLHKSGLDFEPGQVRAVPAPLARSLLRHRDLFEPAADAPASRAKATAVKDDTADKLAQARQARHASDKAMHERLDVLAQVERMDKATLMQFAETQFRQTLKPTDKLEALREQVRQLVERFGLGG